MKKRFLVNLDNQFRDFWILIVIVIVLFCFSVVVSLQAEGTSVFGHVWGVINNTWWFVLPIPAWYIFRAVAGEYTDISFLVKQESVLLEIIPPADTEKSPQIMDLIFRGMHTWSASNKFEAYCGWRPLQDKFTFEMSSAEGDVRFYVRCPKAARDNVEAQIYAQYPDAEIHEAEDYTRKVPRNLPNRDWDVWGTALKLVDRDELPIRTYKYFQESVTGKMIDPLASMAEVMTRIGKDQHIWFQVIFTPVVESLWYPDAKKYLKELSGIEKEQKSDFLARFATETSDFFGNFFRMLFADELKWSSFGEKEEPQFNINQLATDVQEKVKAVHENLASPAFKTVIRFVYLGKKDGFNKALGVAGVMGAVKQFADSNLNSLVPDNLTKTFAMYYGDVSRLQYRQRKIVQDFRDRAGAGIWYNFSTEELATVYHFPDMSVRAPTMSRIEAKKGEAPTNLPVDVDFESS